MLQLVGNGLDVESVEENFKSYMEFFSIEDQFYSNLEEFYSLVVILDLFIKLIGKEDLEQKVVFLEFRSQRMSWDFGV